MANTVDGNVKMKFMSETMSPEFAQSPNPQPLNFFQNAFRTKQDPKCHLIFKNGSSKKITDYGNFRKRFDPEQASSPLEANLDTPYTCSI